MENEEDPRYERIRNEIKNTESNKQFIRVANVIHEQGVTEEMMELIQDIKREKMHCHPRCIYQRCERTVSRESRRMIQHKYGNITTEPIYKEDISDQTLGGSFYCL